jgi:molybdopterin converting factor small subunit
MSIAVTVQYHNILQRGAGLREERLDLGTDTSLQDLLDRVARTRGAALRSLLFTADGDVASHVVIFRNRKLVPRDQLDTKLTDGDEIKLFPAVSGG